MAPFLVYEETLFSGKHAELCHAQAARMTGGSHASRPGLVTMTVMLQWPTGKPIECNRPPPCGAAPTARPAPGWKGGGFRGTRTAYAAYFGPSPHPAGRVHGRWRRSGRVWRPSVPPVRPAPPGLSGSSRGSCTSDAADGARRRLQQNGPPILRKRKDRIPNVPARWRIMLSMWTSMVACSSVPDPPGR